MPWTTINKPTGADYTYVNPTGKEQYDQASISYDDANVFYDGTNMDAWTDIAKPVSGNGLTIRVGMATGLIMPPTYSTPHTFNVEDWTKIAKPTD